MLLWIYSSISFLLQPFANATQEHPIQKPPLVLSIGEQRLLHIPGLTKYTLGSPLVRILSVPAGSWPSSSGSKHPLQDYLLMKGVHAGYTDLWIWKKTGTLEYRTLRIEKNNRSTLPLELEKGLSQLQEVEIIPVGPAIVLRGTILNLLECTKIAGLLKSYPNHLYNETQLSESLLELAEQKLYLWIQKYSFLKLERHNQHLWLMGSIQDETLKKEIQKQATAIFPLLGFDLKVQPTLTPTLYFRIFLIELQRSAFEQLGIQWPTSFEITKNTFSSLSQMRLLVQQWQGSGQAKLLSNPELVVRAPGEAELFAGGELPIQIQTRFYSNINWKKHGLTLKLKVTEITSEGIRLEIFTEVSHLDYSRENHQSLPSLQSNRMQTQVDTPLDTPLLLSGLLQQNIREKINGLTFLKDIPILGLLFRSEDYLHDRSELIAILYPYRHPPSPPPEIPFLLPKGILPPPRDWVSPLEIRSLKMSKDYPWNVFPALPPNG